MRNVTLLLLFLWSCSSPATDKTYSDETVENDLSLVIAELDSLNGVRLTDYMLANVKVGQSMEGKTYAELIEASKVFHEKQMKAEAERQKLRNALRVSLIDKGFDSVNHQDYLTYKLSFENNTDQDIKAFKGQVVFTDLFGKEITRFNLTYDEGIQAGRVVDYSAQSAYNEYLEKDRLMRGKDLSGIKLMWDPEDILFE